MIIITLRNKDVPDGLCVSTAWTVSEAQDIAIGMVRQHIPDTKISEFSDVKKLQESENPVTVDLWTTNGADIGKPCIRTI